MRVLVIGNNHQGVAIGTALQRANLPVKILPYAQATADSLSSFLRPHTVGVFACPRTVCSNNCLLKQLYARGCRMPVLPVETMAH